MPSSAFPDAVMMKRPDPTPMIARATRYASAAPATTEPAADVTVVKTVSVVRYAKVVTVYPKTKMPVTPSMTPIWGLIHRIFQPNRR